MLFVHETYDMEGKVWHIISWSNLYINIDFSISRYKRIFSVGTNGISTYNPSNLEITNRWAYSDFISVTPLKGSQNEFQITMKKEKKIDKMTFSTEHRTHLLTEALKFRNCFLEKPKEVLVMLTLKFQYLFYLRIFLEVSCL